MSINQTNLYNLDAHIAEIYDRQIQDTQDIDLLLGLIGGRGPWKIFEPFCGTGRLLLPLVSAGHSLTGLDQSDFFLDVCRKRLDALGKAAVLISGDATGGEWPAGFDLVVLGGNCLYELATLAEQEGVIRAAASALKPGGCLFVDNDHMEGDLEAGWQDTALRPGFPSGVCVDGVRLESTIQTIACDVPGRVARFRRTVKTIFPDGQTLERSYVQQKHPISTGEIQRAIQAGGFQVEHQFGSYAREPYTGSSPRAIFWARKI